MTSEEIINELINTVRARLKKSSLRINLFSIVGSKSIGKETGDLDFFIILGQNNEEEEIIFDRYTELLEILDNINTEFQEEGILVSFFPTFRLEEVTRKLTEVKENSQDEKILVHLLIYPTKETFKKWEKPMVARNMAKEAELIIGDKNELISVVEKIDVPPRKERLNYLENLLYETIQYVKLGTIPEDTVRKEGLQKLQYITKYTAIEYISDEEETPDEKSWHYIVENIDKIPDPFRSFTLKIYNRYNKENFFNIEELTKNLTSLKSFLKETHSIRGEGDGER